MQAGDVTRDGKTISKVEKIAGVRKMTIANIEESLRRSPQVSGFNHANVSGVVRLKKKLNDAGYKVSVTEIFVKLIAMALQENMDLNASRQGDEIHYYSSVNVSVAMGLKNGMLIVPVIRNCESKSVIEISEELKDIIDKANSGKMTPDMMAGGTITLTSIGMFGVDSTDAIINIPQASIVALGKISKEPCVLPDETIGICDKAFISITVDHAVVNGAPASKFVGMLSKYAEKADELIQIP